MKEGWDEIQSQQIEMNSHATVFLQKQEYRQKGKK